MADTADRLPKVEDFQELVERKAAIRKLLKAVNIKDLNIDKRTCLMCREDYRERVVRKLHDQDEDEVDAPQPERVVSLPCTHVFGKTCVMEWLMRYGSCPWCQAVHLAPGEGFTYRKFYFQDRTLCLPLVRRLRDLFQTWVVLSHADPENWQRTTKRSIGKQLPGPIRGRSWLQNYRLRLKPPPQPWST